MRMRKRPGVLLRMQRLGRGGHQHDAHEHQDDVGLEGGVARVGAVLGEDAREAGAEPEAEAEEDARQRGGEGLAVVAGVVHDEGGADAEEAADRQALQHPAGEQERHRLGEGEDHARPASWSPWPGSAGACARAGR